MREILISIRPEFVEKILNGEKTIEIRKTMPKRELPCKVYIYCTKSKKDYVTKCDDGDIIFANDGEIGSWGECILNGKVVAEFTLKEVETIEKHQVYNAKVMKDYACLSIRQLSDYTKGNRFFAWHITNLKIYDKPKELSEFSHNIPDYSSGVVMYSLKQEPLKRPPQSWCYVEKVEE